MKSFLILVTSLFSFSTFAGGTGGGGVLKSFSFKQNPEIVFSLGQRGDKIRFAHGQMLEGGWKIQKIELQGETEFVESTVIEALIKSEKSKKWEVIR